MGALDGIISYAILYPEKDIDLLTKRIEKIWQINKAGNNNDR